MRKKHTGDVVKEITGNIFSLFSKGSLSAEQKEKILSLVSKAVEMGYDEAYEFYLGDSESAEPFDEEFYEDDDELSWGYSD